ncbi:MAG TPA: radical SAM protein [Candidatus Hydrogenedentes bacterium]|nr:radical SAM protein [Candidatus Hydrogenedentota bacterium]HPG69249.1 radical SAM protein [Candidatus Hydrogenedentota bacterium]
MQDPYGREITYLRVSVTDRCNLRCVYCMPPTGIAPILHDDVLRYEEIAAFVQVAVEHGIRKVRLTGGEPLVRKGIAFLVHQLANIAGVEDLCMTTNGVLLGQFAGELAAAGLHRVNISLDALNPERFAEITRGGNVADVLAGIQAAREARLDPVKLNCVVDHDSSEDDARDVAGFARRQGLEVRFIRRMNLPEGQFAMVEGGRGGHCERCDRLRLSSDGWLKPCLFSDIAVNIRAQGYAEALRQAIALKPERGGTCQERYMHQIGG